MVIMISNDHSLAAWFRELELRGKFQILKQFGEMPTNFALWKLLLVKSLLVSFNRFATKNITSAARKYYNDMFDNLQKQHRNMTAMTQLNGNLTNKNGSYMCRLHVLKICRIFLYKSIHSSSSYFLSFCSVPSNFPTSQTSRPRTPKWMPSNLRWFLKEVQLDFLHKVSFKLAFTFLSFIRFHRETQLIMWNL